MTAPEPTPAQIGYLQAAADGFTSATIARKYRTTEHAVHTDLYRLYKIMGVVHRAHAVAVGIRTGLIS